MKNRLQGQRIDRQVFLAGEAVPQQLEHGLDPQARDDDFDQGLFFTAPKGEGEVAVGLVDRRIEGLSRGLTDAIPELAGTVVGQAIPEALFPGLTVRPHAMLVQLPLFGGGLEEVETVQKPRAVGVMAVARSLAGPLQEPDPRRARIEIAGNLLAGGRDHPEERARITLHLGQADLAARHRHAVEQLMGQTEPDACGEGVLPTLLRVTGAQLPDAPGQRLQMGAGLAFALFTGA